MNDKELLELAAKAAGIEIGELFQRRTTRVLYNGQAVYWNPLADDGDALRLAVKLNLTIKIYGGNTMIYDMDDKFLADFVDCETDTGTRRAIVRAAAEIGRMK